MKLGGGRVVEKNEINELKEAILKLSERMEKLESALLSRGFESANATGLRMPPPFFVKGHDLPVVVVRPREPIRGKFLTLKVLYNEDKPMLIEEICEKTGRSRSLEVNYLGNLSENGWVEKERVLISGRERIKYRITNLGKRVIENFK